MYAINRRTRRFFFIQNLISLWLAMAGLFYIRARYEASPRSANSEALRQLADVAATDDAVNVLCLCLDIAD